MLAWHLPSWRHVRFGMAELIGFGMFAFTARTPGFGWVTKWWAWCIIIPAGVLMALPDKREYVAAGAGWFARERRWVDIYDLTTVKLHLSAGGYSIELRDSAGRGVAKRMMTIQIVPEVWDLLYNGILHSAHSREIETNKKTRLLLHLPPNPPPTDAQRGITPPARATGLPVHETPAPEAPQIPDRRAKGRHVGELRAERRRRHS